ncbi:MAG: hypothetical protein Q8O67_23710 [Deltaproteobacteria bacterium]|nr:hypothetical protein [Deltaproteobacteria bacterium]
MKARKPPAAIFAGQSPEQRKASRAWWASLNEPAKLEFEQMWDSRSENTALYGSCNEGAIEWHELPIELRGALIDDENDREHKQFKQQLLEYISNHEDVRFFLVNKHFHICRAHPAARDVIRSGLLPVTFSCPVGDEQCPMRKILDACPGRSVRLSPALCS